MRNILWQVASTPPPLQKKKPKEKQNKPQINEADLT